MKSFYFIFLIGMAFAVFSCQNDDKKANTQESTPGVQTPVQPQQNAANPSAPVQLTNPGTAGNEPHYKCPNGCDGGVGPGKGACPVCGTEMAHNQAFHNNPTQGAPQANPSITPPPNIQAPQQPTSPAQNAAGVFHYTCPSGCAGGAGAAGPCSSCGTTLVHNQAYHN